jgi:hypothetical protein
MAAEKASEIEPIDYTIGSMDITEQTKTFDVIMGLVKWVSLGIAALLVFLTVWFATEAGFFAGFGAGVALLVLGIFFLKAKNASDRPSH